jgi:hypothetical protein
MDLRLRLHNLKNKKGDRTEEEGGLYCGCRSATRPQNNTTRLRTKREKKQNTPLEQSSANNPCITQAGFKEARTMNSHAQRAQTPPQYTPLGPLQTYYPFNRCRRGCWCERWRWLCCHRSQRRRSRLGRKLEHGKWPRERLSVLQCVPVRVPMIDRACQSVCGHCGGSTRFITTFFADYDRHFRNTKITIVITKTNTTGPRLS